MSKPRHLLLVSLGCAAVAILLGMGLISAQGEAPKYKDPNAPIEERVEDLLSRMTVEEKVAQLGGDETGMSTPDNERLGIPGFKMADGPHGVRHGKATCFPGLLAMAATWDPVLMERMGAAMGREFRAKGRYVALGPCLNIIRDPRGGRSFETLGEDPYLTARMAAADVRGLQSEKVIAVAKHYACNNQENGRGSNDVRVDERTLREIYLPGFRACVQAGGLGIMAAYNKVNGEHCAQNRHLLREVLKEDWGFPGFVVSDWGACHATVGSITAGLDVEMPTAFFFGEPLLEAVERGEVSQEVLDEAVRRVLRAKFWAGVFEKPVAPDESAVNTREHQALALECARRSIVLLKNDGGLLPLDRHKVRSIAVIGPNADVPRPTGGGSAYVTPYYAVSPLEGIRSRANEGTEVLFAHGCDLDGDSRLSAIPASALSPPGQEWLQGLRGEYFLNQNLEGEPVLIREDSMVDFDWEGNAPADELSADHFSVRWTGTLTPPATGDYVLGTTTDDGARLWLDDRLLVDDWHDHAAESRQAKVRLEAGRAYRVRMEYYENGGLAVARLGWVVPSAQDDPFAEAREAARNADVAVVVVGTSASIESEGTDRQSLALPGMQDDLVRAVAAANKNTVVAIVAGSAVLMEPWIDQVPAVLQCWFGGQEAGNALADVLFGNCTPGGKLPVTFPMDMDQLPPFDNNYETVGEGRGYRYYDKHGLMPQFPFGHGLSYTQFRYSSLTITPPTVRQGETVTVQVMVQNVGERQGAEVAQLYLRDVQASVERPVAELKGFQRLFLKPGDKAVATFILMPEDLAFYDVAQKAFVAEPGEFEVRVGSSSRDIRQTGVFTLK